MVSLYSKSHARKDEVAMIMDQDVSVQTRSLGMLTSAQHDLSDLYFFSSDSIHKRIKAALFRQDFLCRDASTAHSRQAEQGEPPHSDTSRDNKLRRPR